MGNSYFQFKQFRIEQDQCAMKVSTDAVVLGAVSGEKTPKTILDIGTGTGVIALILAQRHPSAQVTALEIDDAACLQARQNVRCSPWSERIRIVCSSLQDYQRGGNSFDLIVSNPPYFPGHLTSPDIRRNTALHQDSLTFDELITGVASLLHADGEFWLILPERQMKDFEAKCHSAGFTTFGRLHIRHRKDASILRVIQAFSKRHPNGNTHPSAEELVIKADSGAFSSKYQLLLKDFMLHF
nr:methyltransferase [Cytophagales bacterium]